MTHLLGLEHVAEDLGLALAAHLDVGLRDERATPGHYHNDVADVGDVRDRTQRVVHHYFLRKQSRA